jgi:hypothetical protein
VDTFGFVDHGSLVIAIVLCGLRIQYRLDKGVVGSGMGLFLTVGHWSQQNLCTVYGVLFSSLQLKFVPDWPAISVSWPAISGSC